MSSLQLVAILVVAIPALAVVLWPLVRPGTPGAARGVPPADRRLELEEAKTAAYRALRELAFDHEAGHLSDDDYRGLRERYEGRAAEVLRALDALGPATAAEPVEPSIPGGAARTARWTRHPLTLAAGAVAVLAFGLLLGLSIGRFTTPEQPDMAAVPPPGPSPVGPPMAKLEPGKPIPPAMLAGMLGAARQSLMAGRYGEAIAAYQAVLKRDPQNVDAMTHLGLIVAIGGHADTALETFDKASKIDPNYPPPYLYRGQVLFEVKRDYPGAVKAWQRYLTLVPNGEDHERVAALVKDAQDKQRTGR